MVQSLIDNPYSLNISTKKEKEKYLDTELRSTVKNFLKINHSKIKIYNPKIY